MDDKEHEIRAFVERINRRFGQSSHLNAFLNDNTVLTSTLHPRLKGLEMLLHEGASYEDLEADFRKVIDLLKGKQDFMDFIPLLEKLEVYVLKDTWKHISQGKLPDEKQLKKLMQLSFEDVLASSPLPPISSLPMVHLFKLSLQLEALFIILIQSARGIITIPDEKRLEFSGTFEDISHRYMVQFHLLRTTLFPGESHSLDWKWEGTIGERKSSLEVQHELLDWRANN